jgi:hypothetical protein
MTTVLLTAGALSLLLVVICFFVCRAKKRPFGLEKIVNIPLHTYGACAGGILVGSLFVPDLRQLVTDVAYYGAIGGGAAMYVCIKSIHKELSK